MRYVAVTVLLIAFAVVSCTSKTTPVTGNRDVALSFANLDDVGDQHTYAAWLQDGPTYHLIGEFNAIPGAPAPSFRVSEANFRGSEAVVISIEAAGPAPAQPSAQRILAGEIQGDDAALSIADQRALDDPFTGVGAQYIIETATTSEVNDYNQGIYWCVPGDFLGIPEPVVPDDPNLDTTMPMLPPGWVYEGWVVLDGVPISTGRMSNPLQPDSDGLGPAKGPLPGMPFPGQEYIDPPKDLLGGQAWLTVEPEPDYSPAPSPLKVLVDTDIEDKGPAGMQWTINSAAGTRPSGTAHFTVSAAE
jgi:hypothetical protein